MKPWSSLKAMRQMVSKAKKGGQLCHVDFGFRILQFGNEELDVVVDMGFVVEHGCGGEGQVELLLHGRDLHFVACRGPLTDHFAIDNLMRDFV
jgi:hypothetical protein